MVAQWLMPREMNGGNSIQYTVAIAIDSSTFLTHVGIIGS